VSGIALSANVQAPANICAIGLDATGKWLPQSSIVKHCCLMPVMHKFQRKPFDRETV
jgi:type IV secretory pathway TrbL component